MSKEGFLNSYEKGSEGFRGEKEVDSVGRKGVHSEESPAKRLAEKEPGAQVTDSPGLKEGIAKEERRRYGKD